MVSGFLICAVRYFINDYYRGTYMYIELAIIGSFKYMFKVLYLLYVLLVLYFLALLSLLEVL